MADAIPMAPDQVLAQLRTRGFETGNQRTPLRDFWGRLTDIAGEMRSGDRGPYLVVFYNFDTLEILPGGTVEVYTAPVAQIEIPHNNKDKSMMGYLGTSIDRVINAGVDPTILQENVKGQSFLIGKMCHMKLTPGHMLPKQTDGAWKDVASDCWEVIEYREVDGTAAGPAVQAPVVGTVGTPAPAASAPPGVSATQTALALLNGKTIQQWHQEVFVNPIVKADTTLVNSIISGVWLQGMEAGGIVTKDENGIHTVVTPAT